MTLFLSVVGLLMVAAGIILLIFRVVERREREAAQTVPKSPQQLAEEQARELDRRAQIELSAGRFEAARGLFLAARRPAKAGQVAVREGKFALAGELFERAGAFDKALVAYGKAGNTAKVGELKARLGQQAASASLKPAAATGETQQANATAQTPVTPSLAPDLSGPAPWDTMTSEASHAWLLEDSLLALPEAQVAPKPAPAPQPAPEASGMVGRAALGVVGLIKSARRRGVVEETVARSNDDR